MGKLTDAAKQLLEGSKETFDANIAQKRGMRGQDHHKKGEVGDDRLDASVAYGEKDAGIVGHNPQEMDDKLPDYLKGTPSATPPGATPPVGSEKGEYHKTVGYQTYNDQPQQTMGRKDVMHPAQTTANQYDTIRDRVASPKAKQTMQSNPGAHFQSYGEETEYEGEILDELSKDTLNSYLHKGVAKFKQKAPMMSQSQKNKEVAHLQKAHSKLKAKGGKFEEFELDEYLEMFVEDEKMMKKKKMMKDKMMHDKMKEDIEAIMAGEQLSEEFKQRAAIIYEAAVTSRVVDVAEEIITEMEESLTEQFEEAVEEIKEDLATKVDDYLNYFVEEWTKENEIAIEKGLRAEIVEDFIEGLKTLFVEHYIDIPTEKVDIVEGLTNKVEELEAQLDEQIKVAVELKKDLNEQKKIEAIYTACEGLTQTQVEKMKSLAESVEFTTEEEFADKLTVLKESYFKIPVKAADNSALDEEVDIEEDKKIKNSLMEAYAQTISKTVSK
jgi:hypothetical protein